MNRLSSELHQELIDRAQPFCENDLPYHNWAHAEDVIASAAYIGEYSHAPSVTDNAQLLTIAAAWHDADYHLPIEAPLTKEQRSAALAFDSLPELSEAQRILVSHAIIDTTVNKVPKSNLFGEALHMADLGYFAADNDHFMQRLQLMREEWGSPSWEETVRRTTEFGHHVVIEAQKTMPLLLPERRAVAWVTSIQENIDSLAA